MKPTFLRQTLTLVKNDLRRELRTGETLVTTTAFSVLLLVVFTFGFYRDDQTVALVFPGILWVAVIFAGMLAIARTFLREKESGSLRALALIPRTHTSLYVAKLLVNLLFMAVFEAVLLPLLLLAFEVDLQGQLGGLIAVLAAGTLGFAALGTLISAMLVHSRMRDVLLPLVLFPLIVPLLIGGVRATMLVMRGDRLDAVLGWAQVLFAVDLIFIVGSLLLFRWVLSAIE